MGLYTVGMRGGSMVNSVNLEYHELKSDETIRPNSLLRKINYTRINIPCCFFRKCQEIWMNVYVLRLFFIKIQCGTYFNSDPKVLNIENETYYHSSHTEKCIIKVL